LSFKIWVARSTLVQRYSTCWMPSPNLARNFCDGSRTARLAGGQNVQGDTFAEMKLEFLGILIRRERPASLGVPIGDSNAPQMYRACTASPTVMAGLVAKQQSGEFAFSAPPFGNGGSRGRAAQPVDFGCCCELLGCIGGRKVHDGLSERAWTWGASGIVA